MPGTYITRHPFIRINDSSSYGYENAQPGLLDTSYQNTYNIPQEWSSYQQPNYYSMGMIAVAAPHNYGYPRQSGHNRHASDSTIASTGPDTPASQNSSKPWIVNNDRSPASTSRYPEEFASGFRKQQFPAGYGTLQHGYMPSQASHTPIAHSAMKNMAIDHHSAADEVPDFASSAQSVSSRGYNSPRTPRTAPGEEVEDKGSKAQANDYRQGPRVELYRTESAACQDELYNPANFLPNASTQPAQSTSSPNTLLSPHRNLVNERLQTANSIRSQSPNQAASRERSPFRHGSPLAPANEGFRTPAALLNTAAAFRQQQKEESDAAERAQHRPQLNREETKTISPKDAMLDYNPSDADQANDMPLFTDSIPAGYQRHTGGSEMFADNFISGTNQAFGQFVPHAASNLGGFRAIADDGSSGQSTYNFLPPQSQMPANPYVQQQQQQQQQPSHQQQAAQQLQQYRSFSNMPESTPEFPAHLTSMESSISEGAAPPSSQESAMNANIIQRPANTSANTGTYTCTYHGCSQRFESPQNLQKHKRETHQPNRDASISLYTTASPPSGGNSNSSDESHDDGSESPAPSVGSGMTSSALLARNSQAGPHKCARINPSTGKPCNTIFSRPYDLTRHEDTIHNRQKQKVRCQYCREEKTFSRNDALTRHMRVVHPEIEFQGRRGKSHF